MRTVIVAATLMLLAATGAGAARADTAATAAYKQAMNTMMMGMGQPYTGDPDRDFVQGMVPHHQGAIDMARVELTYGRDPVLKQLARSIIASQGREQAFMRQWLARHPAR